MFFGVGCDIFGGVVRGFLGVWGWMVWLGIKGLLRDCEGGVIFWGIVDCFISWGGVIFFIIFCFINCFWVDIVFVVIGFVNFCKFGEGEEFVELDFWKLDVDFVGYIGVVCLLGLNV